MIAPTAQYEQLNEAQFRSQLEQDQLRTVRTDRAVQSILLIGDDQQVYRVSVVGGLLDVTAV